MDDVIIFIIEEIRGCAFLDQQSVTQLLTVTLRITVLLLIVPWIMCEVAILKSLIVSLEGKTKMDCK